MQQRMQAFDAKLKTILNDSQYSRYHQLEIQSAGPRAFERPDVAQALNLSEEQHNQMRQIIEAERPQPPQPGQGGNEPPQPPQPMTPEEMRAKQNALMDKLLKVLDSGQLATWKSLTGAKFEFTLGQQPRQGGGQGGPGNGRPGGGGGQGGGLGGGTDSKTEDAAIVF